MLAALSGEASTLENTVFLYIGALRARPASHDAAQPCDGGYERRSPVAPEIRASGPIRPWAKTDYIVAVNLCDLSVVLVYIAWHDDPETWELTDDECREFGMDPVRYERFKPQNDGRWACLPGFEDGFWPYTSHRVMAKIAENVHEWNLGNLSTSFSVGPALLPPDSVPVLESIDPDT